MQKSKTKKLLWLSLFVYFLSLFLYAVFSYSLSAPNLVLSHHPLFWKFQSFMWQTFFNDRQLLSQAYMALITIIITAYLFLSSQILRYKFTKLKKIGLLLLILLIPLLMSMNALSYDVFNYIFNAKMFVVYEVDPHVRVAQDFADDPWTKFMHNIHTTAPYGKAWTYLSVVPFTLGMERFLPTWLLFRLFSLLPLLVLMVVFWKYEKRINQKNLIFFILSPLVLIETISNFHNDYWMITPAILSLLLVDSSKKKWQYLLIPASLLLLAFSIWVKLATVLLIPVWLMIFSKRFTKGIPRFQQLIRNWPLWASLLMFLPLLTTRSQQFHPWYLSWTLAFIPLFLHNKLSKIWSLSLIVLSFSSLYRYLPFLFHNNYEEPVLLWQKIITFTPFVLALFILSFQSFKNKKR